MDQDESAAADILQLTAQIVAAHLTKNPVSAEGLVSLIQDVYRALAGAGRDAPPVERPQPAVPVRKSVFPEYLVCLEDGKKLKMLRRHLKTAYNLTPDQYRERWGLPADYPMVAPKYASERSSLAKRIGLGVRARGRG